MFRSRHDLQPYHKILWPNCEKQHVFNIIRIFLWLHFPLPASSHRLEESRLWVGQVHWGLGQSSCGGGTTASTTQPRPSTSQHPPGVSFRMQEMVVEKVWLFFDNEVNVPVGIRADLSGKHLLNVSSSREPQWCICWCWLQRYPPLPLLGCCQEGPGPHWVPGWFRGEDGTMTPV